MPTLRETYDAVADAYARQLQGELAGKPFDRLMLDHLVELVGDGVLCDLGCGPGQVARYLKDAGAANVFGLDLSERMVEEARAAHPDIRFEQGDFLDLAAPDASWDGVAAFYSIVHTPTHKLAGIFLELARVVRPGGWLLLAFHAGHETKHLDSWFDQAVDIDFHFHHRGTVDRLLRASGWRVRDTMERAPYAEDVEYPSRRGYMRAERVIDAPWEPKRGA